VQRAVTPDDEVDPRLSQKITYDSGYKRLHAVIEDIARTSKVSIACGQSTKDWRVRDIPVVVCVKDMPLGKLLQGLEERLREGLGEGTEVRIAPRARQLFVRVQAGTDGYWIGFPLPPRPDAEGLPTRAIAWTFPLMGREGALNQFLVKLHIVSEPISEFGFSTLSVRLAMIQLYILFMITPLFFTLAQVDRTAIEAARDLGGNWYRTFVAVILPQTLPGIVIGSIFIFVLTMGEYGTVLVVGQNYVQSVGTIVNSYIVGAVQYPQGAAAAVLLVLALIVGVFAITRFSNLREDL
jgi:ABC-type molybdate transport system permease subunit